MAITQVIGFTEPFVGTQQFYVGLTFDRTATGSGTGTETETRLVTALRTATGSGAGTQSATRLITSPRTAIGSGVGSAVVVGAKSSLRTASGSGIGSSTISSNAIMFRTATGSGFGSEFATAIEIIPRTATASGQGSTIGNATWTKSRIFRVPNTTNYAFAELFGDRMADRLFAHMPPGVRAENLYRLSDGSYTINDPGHGRSTRAYLGGHNIFLDDTEVAELTAAGYGAYIS